MVFDTSRLVSFTESLLYNQPAVQHTPLVKEFGRLVITSDRLYFQVGTPIICSKLCNKKVAGGPPIYHPSDLRHLHPAVG